MSIMEFAPRCLYNGMSYSVLSSRVLVLVPVRRLGFGTTGGTLEEVILRHPRLFAFFAS
jgi:hypothetical protein